MRRKNNLIIIGFLLLISLCGCDKCTKNIPEKINIKDWNKQTLAFLSDKVNFPIYNSKEKHNYPAIKVDGSEVNSMEEDINHMLSFRAIAINELIKTYKVKSCKLDIREYYHHSWYLYTVRDDQENIYYIRINGITRKIEKSYLVIDHSEKLNFGSWFDEGANIENNYILSIENGLRTLTIYSKFHINKDSLIIEFPYVLMLDE